MWPSKVQHNGPSTGIIKYWLARLWLTVWGWNVDGTLPKESKYVMVGGPHTSNWDFVFALPALYVFRIKVYWMGKDSLFKWPIGGIMRALGGIPINRRAAHGVVFQTVQQFKQSDRLVIVIPAKGTRSRTDYWKSGFYHIAREAGVPVVCGTLDYANKTARIGYSFVPTGDVKADMDKVRAFYAPITGKRPELADNIRLKEENN